MMPPDEPWMRGNPTTRAPRAAQARPAEAVAAASPLHSQCVSRSRAACVAHSEMDLSGVALLMRYIVMSAQAEGAKQNDC